MKRTARHFLAATAGIVVTCAAQAAGGAAAE